jgi:hypothetical protein
MTDDSAACPGWRDAATVNRGLVSDAYIGNPHSLHATCALATIFVSRELINFAGLGSPTQAWGGRAMQQSLCIIPGADIQHPALRHAMTMNTSIKLLIIKKLIKTTIIVKMVLII